MSANDRINNKDDVFDFIYRRANELRYNRSASAPIQIGDLKEIRREWLEESRELIKQEEDIERYCYGIRKENPIYEMSFEEYLKHKQGILNLRASRIQQISNKIDAEASGFLAVKPKGMTHKQWTQEKRRRKRLEKEKEKQAEDDRKLERDTNPLHLFSKRIDKIGCRCIGEEIRQGKICETCKLIVKVDNYLLDLFRHASEKRDRL
jgi:hypothetical protein